MAEVTQPTLRRGGFLRARGLDHGGLSRSGQFRVPTLVQLEFLSQVVYIEFQIDQSAKDELQPRRLCRRPSLARFLLLQDSDGRF